MIFIYKYYYKMAKSNLLKSDTYIEIENAPVKSNNGNVQNYDITLSLNSRDILESGNSVIIHGQNGSSITLDYKETTIEGVDATSPTQIYDWFQSSAFASSGGGSGGTVDWSAIQNKPTTFTPSAHTHNASEIIFDDSNVGTVLATALKNNDVGKTLVNFTSNGITIKNDFSYESAVTTAKTKIYFSNVQAGVNITSETVVVNTTNGESNFYSSTGNGKVTFSLPVNIRGDLNFQGGAITNLLLWKNSAGTIRPISNHPNATDGALVLPKNAGTLALAEEIPTTIGFDKITGVGNGNIIIGGASGNQQRKLVPSDLGLTVNNILVKSSSDDTFVQVAYRSVPNNNSIAQRTATGTLKGTTAVADDDLTTFLQVKGLTDASAINAKIKTYLLALPNATAGNVLKINSTGDDFEWVTP